MFLLEADPIPFEDTELTSTAVQYFGKSMDDRVRLSDPEH